MLFKELYYEIFKIMFIREDVNSKTYLFTELLTVTNH